VSNLSRRGLLGTLFGAASSAVLDPERALWQPGAKTISIPAPVVLKPIGFTVGDVFTIDGVYSINPITRSSTGMLRQFVVTQSGLHATLSGMEFHPSIQVNGQYANSLVERRRGPMRPNPIMMGKTIGSFTHTWGEV
jgi:hypothetical protein